MTDALNINLHDSCLTNSERTLLPSFCQGSEKSGILHTVHGPIWESWFNAKSVQLPIPCFSHSLTRIRIISSIPQLAHARCILLTPNGKTAWNIEWTYLSDNISSEKSSGSPFPALFSHRTLTAAVCPCSSHFWAFYVVNFPPHPPRSAQQLLAKILGAAGSPCNKT